MAARRLVIVMAVLLIASTTLAILLPRSDLKRNDDANTGTTAATGATSTTDGARIDGSAGPTESGNKTVADAGGDVVTRTVKGTDQTGKADQPQELDLMSGDRLILNVDLGRPARIAIPGLGLTGNTTKYSPATFDILISNARPQKVIDVDDGKVLAKIVVGTEDES